MKNKRNKREKGITLVSLVVTIIVLLILVGISLRAISDENGLIKRAQDASIAHSTSMQEEQDKINDWREKLKNARNSGKTSESIVDEILTSGDAVELNYIPKESNKSVVIPSICNGNASEQTFTQNDLGIKELKWYILSKDENGVNLLSESTKCRIGFVDSGGYDNCLYYLKQIATTLVANEDMGVTEDRVHAFCLSDIKNAAEYMNTLTNCKVIEGDVERNWDWNLEVIRKNSSTYNNGDVGLKIFTPYQKKYPRIYGTSTGTVTTNNPLYDESVPENFTPIQGDLIATTSKTASTLRVNYTFINTGFYSYTKEMMGNFGKSEVFGKILTQNSQAYALASRSIQSYSDIAYYSLRQVDQPYNNRIVDNPLISSDGNIYGGNYLPYKFVVSVPYERIKIVDGNTLIIE